MVTQVAYAIFDQQGHRRSSGVWLTLAHAQAAAAALHGFAEVRPTVVSDAPDPLTVPTGANAGTPGHFTPRGANLVADLVSMVGIVSDPVTAWTTGQSVVLGDASEAHWSGTAWVVGAA